ncbi:MAG: DUF192 domain-containing protein [Candidatus Omnitrophica bacterium]|nr:DUF192 domain-containing protein [Candidatus Omnitrophota bacterium]
MKITNITRNTLLADKAVLASSLFSRMKGLLGRSLLGQNEALILRPCNSIHTFFMRFSIDIIFLDRTDKVVALKENMPAFRITSVYPGACQAIELPAHAIFRSKTHINDQIQMEK